MGKKVQAPASPDYAGAAQAQGVANKEASLQSTLLASPRLISTPYGNQEITFDENLQPRISQYLNPTSQAAVDQQQQAELGLATLANQQTGAIGNILNTPFSFGSTPQTSLGPAAPLATATDPSAFSQAGGAGFGSVDTSRPQSPNLQQSLDESQIARAPINAGTTAQQAIMARLAPELARRRTSYETQLVNQGLRPGGEAYDNAARLLGEQENDLLSQAALQGIGLDMAANQQGFGQALSRGEFGNQAALQGFGADVTGTQLVNASQAQGFGQTQSQEAARNAALQQNYQNQLAYQQAQNAAQQQGFNQNLQGAQFGNTALQQQLAQALTLRDNPINEITALMSGSQVQNPQFQPYQSQPITPAPVFQGTQAQGQWDMNRYEQEVAQRNALLGGIFGLAAAPFSMFRFGK